MDNFSIQQSDAQVQAILNKIQPLVDTNSVAPLGFGYGVCGTAGTTAAKSVSMSNTVLTPGGIIAVLFTHGFISTNPTLSVNGSAGKPIKLFGSAIPVGKVKDNTTLTMSYDGTNFNVIFIDTQAPATPGAVDLGLPSGTLWCDHNVGGSKPTDWGWYFSWGNVDGHPEGSGYDFSDANYNASAGAALTGNISVGNDYDMARKNMGAPWRLPTEADFVELNSNCTSIWTTQDGVAGRRFTSNINGNSIFFPASGFYYGTSLYSRGSDGNDWSSSCISATDARNLDFYSSGVNPSSGSYRRYGFTVRAVQ